MKAITNSPFTAAWPKPSTESSYKGASKVDGPAGPFGSFVIGFPHSSAPETLLKGLRK